MKVYWNRKENYTEVSCNCAHNAAVLLCRGHKLIRLERAKTKTIYVFKFETFQRFPRFEPEFTTFKKGIPKKVYFDTYRQLLDGRQSNLLDSSLFAGASK